LLTLLTLVAIVIGITGFELPTPRFGTSSDRALLPGVRAVSATTLSRVGSGAPAGSELAFFAVEPTGNLVVTDARRHTVLRFDVSGHLLSEWGPTFGDTELTEPAGVAVARDSYYVVDRGTPSILRLDISGGLQARFDLQPLSPYGLNGLAVDASGNLYAADTGRNRLLVLSPSGQLIKQVGHGGSDLGAFTQPMMLAFAPDGSFFVSDWENNRIERFDTSFEATNAWPIGFHAFGLAVDRIGRVFAPDADHRRIEVFTPQGVPLGELGAPSSPTIDISPKQLAFAGNNQLALYVLGTDGIQRLDLENTPPPPQGGGAVDADLASVAVLVLLAALVGLAVLARRQRRAAVLLGATPNRPVGLHAKDGAQRQDQQAKTNEELLVANKTEGEQ
jgi:DNA-binding beta-propeller fold protein YncE